MSLLPSIFFTTSVAHSFDLAAALRRHGARVYPVSGQTPDSEEKRLYQMFRDGEIDGLSSCNVLQEGFNSPVAMAAFMARPTASGLLFRQMCGRVTRPFPAPTGERHYQKTSLQEILEHLKEDITLQLLVLPTGCGKTFVVA